MSIILWLSWLEYEVTLRQVISDIHCYTSFHSIYSYVKVYIHKKREANGGWPLSYGLNPYRSVIIIIIVIIIIRDYYELEINFCLIILI